jgi:hypothetical protein
MDHLTVVLLSLTRMEHPEKPISLSRPPVGGRRLNREHLFEMAEEGVDSCRYYLKYALILIILISS